GAQLRREVDDVILLETVPVVGEWLAARVERHRLRRRIPFARHIAFLNRPLFDRPDRLAVRTIEHVQHRLLGRLRERLDRPSVDGDIRENRRARDIEIPDAVVHQLVVPLALAGLEIKRDDAFAEEIIARSVTAVVVAGRHLDRQIHHAQFFIDGYLAPHAIVPAVRPRVIEPRVVAVLAALRNRVEDPEPLARLHVVAADISLLVGLPLRRNAAAQMRGADDDRVAGDDRGSMQADLAVDQIHGLVVFELQIDHAVLAEARDRVASLRVERDEPVAWRDVDNSLLAAVAPVRKPASGKLARRGVTTRPLDFAVDPEHLAGGRIERDDSTARPGRGIDDATRFQRRRFEIELRSGTEVLGLEPPRHLELVEIAGVDLIQRSVARVGEIAAVGRPLAAFRACLARNGERHPNQKTHQRDNTEIPPTNRVSHDSSGFSDAELIKSRRRVQYHRATLDSTGSDRRRRTCMRRLGFIATLTCAIWACTAVLSAQHGTKGGQWRSYNGDAGSTK